ncbi:MAG: hypothetical protein ABEN55_02450, partial [Bradymonadaceae bacterium]
DTYRVEAESVWRWNLEGKNEDRLLLRGLLDRHQTVDLSAERREEIERMPMRVFVRSIFDGAQEGEICMLIHEVDSDEVAVGALYAEAPEDGEMWIGVTQFVEGLNIDIWERIVRESYLDIHRDDLDQVARIDAHFFGPDEDLEFQI